MIDYIKDCLHDIKHNILNYLLCGLIRHTHVYVSSIYTFIDKVGVEDIEVYTKVYKKCKNEKKG